MAEFRSSGGHNPPRRLRLGAAHGSRLPPCFGLPVELLRRAGDLVDDAFSLRACIAGDATEALLRLSAEISCRADDAIFVHGSTSLRICYERCSVAPGGGCKAAVHNGDWPSRLAFPLQLQLPA